MSEFRTGWWAVNRRDDASVEMWYFESRDIVTLTALRLSNGDQLLYFRPSANQPHLLRAWEPHYEFLGQSSADETWDNDRHGAEANASMQVPQDFVRSTRQPSAQELSVRVDKADECKADGLSCVRDIHVGIFFDGTNNNMKRDRKGVGHSNVVSLYDAHKVDRVEYFKYYIPGVGTPFPEIGEFGEDSQGKSMARGGEARIHYAMIMLYNAVFRSVTRSDLVSEAETKRLINGFWTGLRTLLRTDDGAMKRVFKGLDKRLLEQVKGKRPVITHLHLSVFGFSRGAAEARTFVNWLTLATQGRVGPAVLNIRFLGLYDTVASVLLADSSPVGSGFMDWANQTMRIPDGVEQTVHYCAGHEIRRSFPLSTLRLGGVWPSRAKEFVYPGVHSDIGGGYSPGDQGKGRAGRSDLLSQIPLNDMHFEGINAGVKLNLIAEMQQDGLDDFEITSQLQSAFSSYLQWTSPDETGENVVGSERGHMEGRMQMQMRHYWRWRAKYTNDAELKRLRSWRHASAQEKVDLEEGNKDWQVDLQRARAAHAPQTVTLPKALGGATLKLPAGPSQTQRDLVKEVDAAGSIPGEADRFFDDYVHDSHAGFWLLGPITRLDKAIFVNEIRRRNAMRSHHLQAAARYNAAGQYEEAAGAYMAAQSYELNRFEQQVLAVNPADINPDVPAGTVPTPVPMPVMNDTDAADLRDNDGLAGWVVKNIVGSGTRREPNGAGQYRRVMDRDHESVFQPSQELEHQWDRGVDAAKERLQEIADDARQAAEDVKQEAKRAAANAIGRTLEAGKEAVKDGVKRILPSGLPR